MFEIFLGIAILVVASKVAPELATRLSSQRLDGEAQRRMQEMEERLEQTEERLLSLASDSHERLVDIEERVDFTERMLQRQRSQGQLPEGK
jgi:aminoglycoside N3'-acetyltransferase